MCKCKQNQIVVVTRPATDQIEYEKDVPSGLDMCRDFERTSSEYKIAFYTNITCVVLPILISYAICVWELKCILSRNFQWYSHMKPWKRFFPWTGLLLIGIPFAPFFILYVAIRHVIFKFQHQKAIRKNEVRRQLQKSEYYWGILRTGLATNLTFPYLLLRNKNF